jgi:hypothetical protein
MDIKEVVERAKKIMQEDRTMDAPGLAASLFRDLPEIKEAGLNDLAWILSSPRENCHRNDVLGLIELLQEAEAKKAEARITED